MMLLRKKSDSFKIDLGIGWTIWLEDRQMLSS